MNNNPPIPSQPHITQQDLDDFAILRAQLAEATKRKAAKKKDPKKPIMPTPQWVWDRYNYAYRQYRNTISNPTKKPDVTLTKGIEEFIKNFIKWNGGSAKKYNVEGRLIQQPDIKTSTGQYIKGKTFRIKSSSRKGATDIDALYKGKALYIEVKNEHTKDTIKEHQSEYAAEITAAGGHHFICRNVIEFMQWWDGYVMNLFAGM